MNLWPLHSSLWQVLYGEYGNFVVTPIFGAIDYAAAFAQSPSNEVFNEVSGRSREDLKSERDLGRDNPENHGTPSVIV